MTNHTRELRYVLQRLYDARHPEREMALWAQAKALLDEPEEMATPRPVGETNDGRMVRKAADLRSALIQYGLAVSPDPKMAFDALSFNRRARWLRLAMAYTEIFDR